MVYRATNVNTGTDGAKAIVGTVAQIHALSQSYINGHVFFIASHSWF
jgi:hypothetical protein